MEPLSSFEPFVIVIRILITKKKIETPRVFKESISLDETAKINDHYIGILARSYTSGFCWMY